MKKLIYLLMFLLLVNVSYGAVVHGEVYIWDTLEEIDAKVEVNSGPKQVDVVKGGEYSFELKKGSYIISAISLDGSYAVNETLVIEDENDDIVFDLLLYDPEIEDLLGEEVINPGDFEFGGKSFGWFWLIVVLIIVGAGYIFMRKMKPSEEKIEKEVLEADEELDKVLEIIKENNGRVTQKEIRKKMMPLSEAKVSLLVTELEDKGLVKRIKKGRGNVIILKK